MELHLLDMGTEKYGDCILITKGNKKILIDGAHKSDAASIRFQLTKLLGQQPPFRFDLLVVTHCHADHIGCLPELVKLGDIAADTALLADPIYRWMDGFDAMTDGDTLNYDAMLAEALNEEDRSDMPDQQLEQFLYDGLALGPGYQEMIDTLRDDNCDVLLFQGSDKDYSAFEDKFAEFGLKIIGPTNEHLKVTQDSLRERPSDVIVSDFINAAADTNITITDAYRRLASSNLQDSASEDAFENKGAINSQSIVLELESEGWKALLAGDMQFSKAEVTGLKDIMKALVEKVNEVKYDFMKTSHHSASNGLNRQLIEKWVAKGTKLFAHTGGLYDPSHPNKTILTYLQEYASSITFARTDRNGIISVGKESGQLKMWIAKGDFNNFEPNPKIDDVQPVNKIPQKESAPPATVSAPAAVVERKDTNGFVEVTAKIPHTSTTVRLTIEVEPEKKKVTSDLITAALNLPAVSNRFENLLFVTCSERLKANIGETEAGEIIEWLKNIPKARFIDVPPTDDPMVAKDNVVTQLQGIKGVVLIGGYDVLPALQLDVLDAELREALTESGEVNDDHDGFIIWSDDIYSDTDNDTLPELPVSRIPDGKSAELVLKSLSAKPFTINSKFGIRNLARPFAIDIYDIIPASQNYAIEVSEQCSPTHIPKDSAMGAVYYMLHGSDSDATRFWGERARGGYYEALDISNIPQQAEQTVIFSGCCWGALTVQPPAYKKTAQTILRPLTSDQSIALAYLKSGASAFVGCTGTHYSPTVAPFNFFGKPMHDAFWRKIGEGKQASEALFAAKQEYAIGLPHGLEKNMSKAIEMKILRQFTCLGLGW